MRHAASTTRVGSVLTVATLLCALFAIPCSALDGGRRGSRTRIHDDARQKHKLLVLVIAGGTKSVYYPQRSLWRLVAEHVRPMGVHVYLVARSPNVRTPTLQGTTILFPDELSVPKSERYKTERFERISADFLVETLAYVLEARLPGKDAPHILRTNLSSFWRFDRLLQWLEPKAIGNYSAGFQGVIDGHTFLSGAGLLLSRDVASLIVRQRHALDTTQIDDVAVSAVLRTNQVTMDAMTRCDDFARIVDALPHEFAGDVYHWRMKAPHAPMQDLALWASLYLKFYGPSMAV
jgi:hypothetical protein